MCRNLNKKVDLQMIRESKMTPDEWDVLYNSRQRTKDDSVT